MNYMILYHISTSPACWIASSKSDILNYMILYHKIHLNKTVKNFRLRIEKFAMG